MNSMSDVYHAAFTFDMIARVFDIMNHASKHQFLLLTKRPERALRYASRVTWTPNIWIGTSVEDMQLLSVSMQFVRSRRQAFASFPRNRFLVRSTISTSPASTG